MDQRGSVSAEYALIATGIAAAVAFAVAQFGARVAPLFDLV